jgi:hypothetical protein
MRELVWKIWWDGWNREVYDFTNLLHVVGTLNRVIEGESNP